MTDPVRARRATIDRWNRLATRLGYVSFAVAIVVFVVGVIVGFSDAFALVVIAAMVIGSILLAPAIVIGYAVKAAEREDRQRGI